MAILPKFGSDKHGAGQQPDKASRIKIGSAVGYTHLPGIFPRLRRLGEHFGQFAYLLALIYRSARLLPAGHPMLNPVNIGRYGVRDFIATAANGLVLKRENMDQIVIFGAVLMALIMIVVQAVLIALYALVDTTTAQAADGYFVTPSPSQDIIFQFLRQVFGVEGIFGSTTVTAVHKGFHAILGFYSTAMMLIAVLIVVYYVITVVGESAQSGQPFGRRFNGLWAPIRLVLALGLLVPLGAGLNAAQYLTLYVAKFGSGLASQGWKTFTQAYALDKNTISGVGAPSMQNIGMFVFTAEACRAGFNQVHGATNPVKIYFSYTGRNGLRYQEATFGPGDLSTARSQGSPHLTYSWAASKSMTTTPTCGSFNMDITLRKRSDGSALSAPEQAANRLQEAMQQKFVDAIKTIVEGVGGISSQSRDSPVGLLARSKISTGNPDYSTDSKLSTDTIVQKAAQAIDAAQEQINAAAIDVGKDDVREEIVNKMKQEASTRGWGTAGSYYVSISKVNHMITESVNKSMPVPLEGKTGYTQGAENDYTGFWSFGWLMGKTDAGEAVKKYLQELPAVYNAIPNKMTSTTVNPKGKPRGPGERVGMEVGIRGFGSPLLWLAHLLFGDAFVQLMDEPTINPLPVLVGAGGTILDRAEWIMYAYVLGQAGALLSGIIGLGVGALLGGPGGALLGGAWGAAAGQLLSALGGILWMFMIVGLAAGIVLYYLLPLMPFMYFFYSVVNWVIEVAEAVIAMPLFALAHLRIDGEGLPGQTAYSGYLTLFGVMLRPILIVIGLIVSSLIFSGGAYFLNMTYKEAIFAYQPQSGASVDFSQISAFGIITYLVMYVYLIYLLANSSFKLIDLIPDKAMRWIGGNTPFTGDKPVDIGSMQGMALAGYGVLHQGHNAANSIVNASQSLTNRVGSNLKGKGGSKPTT